jgi:hypothetical protein
MQGAYVEEMTDWEWAYILILSWTNAVMEETQECLKEKVTEDSLL